MRGDDPLSQQALRVERLRALNAYETAKAATRMPELAARIAKGEQKIAHASANAIDSTQARLKLDELKAELEGLERQHDIPCEVVEWLWAVSQSLGPRNLPKGAMARIEIPGVCSLAVALDEPEPPF